MKDNIALRPVVTVVLVPKTPGRTAELTLVTILFSVVLEQMETRSVLSIVSYRCVCFTKLASLDLVTCEHRWTSSPFRSRRWPLLLDIVDHDLGQECGGIAHGSSFLLRSRHAKSGPCSLDHRS